MEKWICIVVISLICSHFFTIGSSQCSGGWKSIAGKCVQFLNNDRMSWPNAESACQSKGGTLLSIKNLNTMAGIRAEAARASKSGWISWWTGLHKSDSYSAQCKPNWRWNDDQNSDISQVKWLQEPNNAGGDEHCVELLKNGLANDDVCERRRGFICKYVPTNGGQCDHEWVSGGPFCYYFSTRSDSTATDWINSRMLCKNSKPGADLLWIDQIEEKMWIKDRITKLWSVRGDGGRRGWWIGANDLPNGDRGPYKWNDMEQSLADPQMFLDWDKEPTNVEGSTEFCAVMAKDGTFRDHDCFKGRGRALCAAPGPCQQNWIKGPDGQCFLFDTAWLSWYDARSKCKQTPNGDLVKITRSDVKGFLIGQLISRDFYAMWTGFNDRDQGARCAPWMWSDGSKAGPGVIQWWKEPNNYGKNEHVCEIMRNGVFNDASKGQRKGYICKVSLDVESKRMKRQASCEDDWQAGGGKCFKFIQEKLKMQDAQTQCRGMGADLLNIQTQSVKKSIESLVQNNTWGTWWTGLKRDDVPSCGPNWRWNDEFVSDTSFVNWEFEPNNLGGTEHCVEIIKNGVHNDIECDHPNGYICKYAMPPGTSACDPEFVKDNNNCYYFSTRSTLTRITWPDARTRCDALQQGADLLTITSRDERDFIKEYVTRLARINPGSSRGWWTGLRNGPTDNAENWKWLGDSNPADTTFIDWDYEPNNFNGKSLCASLRSGSTIAVTSRSCNQRRKYFCQTTGQTCSSGYTQIPGTQKCFSYTQNEKAAWRDAQAACQVLGGELFTITDLQTQQFITQNLGSLPGENYWIGLHDTDQNIRCHPWKWRDGLLADDSLVNWNKEPNNWSGNDHCVTIHSNGVLNDVPCGSLNAYICRYDLPTSAMDTSGTNGKCLVMTNFNTKDTAPEQYGWHWEACTDFAMPMCEMAKIGGACPQDFPMSYMNSCYKRGTQWNTDHAANSQWCKQQNQQADSAYIDSKDEVTQLGLQLKNDGVTGFAEFSIKGWRGVTACNQAGWGWKKRQQSCYLFSSRDQGNGMKVTDARNVCQQAGGDLVSFRDADEAEWVRYQVGLNWMFTSGTMQYWTALTDAQTPGIWYWMGLDMTPANRDFLVWERDPNDWDAKSYCTYYYVDGTFHTIPCDTSTTGYICQKNAGGTSGPNINCPFGWRERDGYCYFFSPREKENRKTWEDARTTCQTLQLSGDLLSIANTDEAEWVRDQVGLLWLDRPKNPGWWTGLNDLPSGDKGPWRWTDITPYDERLVVWNEQPNTFGDMKCGNMVPTGNFAAQKCSSELAVICQQGGGGSNASGSTGGMNGGQKAGIAIGIIVTIAFMALIALLVYKMRTGPRPPTATGGLANVLYGKE